MTASSPTSSTTTSLFPRSTASAWPRLEEQALQDGDGFSMLVAFGTLAVLLVDTSSPAGLRSAGTSSNPPSTVPAEAGAGRRSSRRSTSGSWCSALGPDRGPDRDLPRGVRRPHTLVESADRGQHPGRRSALDRLRDPRARVHRPWNRDRPGGLRRRPHPHARRPADGRGRLARGHPRRSRTRFGRENSLSGRRSGRLCGASPARPRSRAWRPARFRALASGRRDRAAVMVGRRVRRVRPGALRRVPAFPVQIYNWAKQPDPEFQTFAAAGAIVLLAIVLSMNAVAIFLRIRYRRQW